MAWQLSAFTDEAGHGLATQIDACRQSGLRRLDLRRVDGVVVTELPLDHAGRVAAALGEAGLSVQMFGSPIGKIDIADDVESDLKRLRHLGELRDTFGASAVRIFSYYNRGGASGAQWRRATLDRLNALRDEAGRLGLHLYHENESGIYGDEIERVLEIAELREPGVFSMIYDFANYIRAGRDGLATWRLAKPVTDAFHLKDQTRDGEHTPMGRGDTDAEAILRDAVESGWGGPLTVEPHLKFSEAVVATGVHGRAAVDSATMTQRETFAMAVAAAQELLTRVGADWT